MTDIVINVSQQYKYWSMKTKQQQHIIFEKQISLEHSMKLVSIPVSNDILNSMVLTFIHDILNNIIENVW